MSKLLKTHFPFDYICIFFGGFDAIRAQLAHTKKIHELKLTNIFQ